ncbi:MAG: S41 family peptidase [Patescibacteria group bacterium]
MKEFKVKSFLKSSNQDQLLVEQAIYKYNSPSMKSRFSISALKNLIIISLIFVLGGVVGFKYAQGDLPYFKPANLAKKGVQSKLSNTFQPQEFKDIDFQQFWEVWRILESQYVDPDKVDAEKMVDGALSGLVGGLGDPYSFYLPPKEKQRTAEDLQGSFYGVGIQLGYVDQTLAVMAPLKGGPAEKTGIQAGDLILHVKDEAKSLDEDTSGWSLSEAVNKIRGKRGTKIILTMYRKNNGSEPFDVTITRAEIVVPSVELQLVGSGIESSTTNVMNSDVISQKTLDLLKDNDKKAAYVRVSSFNERTKAEWDQAVKTILAKNGDISGVIIDFRNNPGGLLERAIELSSDFIIDGVVVTQKGRYKNRPFQSMGQARLKDYPVIILVNKGSASASEIVAGALRDRINAKLIGEQTFGKGTVQDRQELSNGGALHVTIAKWLLPGGQWIHEEGIPVDVEVKDDPETEEDEVIVRALEEL